MTRNNTILIFIVLNTLAILSFISKGSSSSKYESKSKAFEERQVIRDSIINAQNLYIENLKIERDSLIASSCTLKIELDSAFNRIENLSSIIVTDEDRLEALLWIKEYNTLLNQ